MELLQRFDLIEEKVQQLLSHSQRLKDENAILSKENENLKATISKNEEMVASLKRQLEKAQQALDKKQENDPDNSVQLRKQLDKYIEEIDKCIEWLENA